MPPLPSRYSGSWWRPSKEHVFYQHVEKHSKSMISCKIFKSNHWKRGIFSTKRSSRLRRRNSVQVQEGSAAAIAATRENTEATEADIAIRPHQDWLFVVRNWFHVNILYLPHFDFFNFMIHFLKVQSLKNIPIISLSIHVDPVFFVQQRMCERVAHPLI